jgi:hypothetical protein
VALDVLAVGQGCIITGLSSMIDREMSGSPLSGWRSRCVRWWRYLKLLLVHTMRVVALIVQTLMVILDMLLRMLLEGVLGWMLRSVLRSMLLLRMLLLLLRMLLLLLRMLLLLCMLLLLLHMLLLYLLLLLRLRMLLGGMLSNSMLWRVLLCWLSLPRSINEVAGYLGSMLVLLWRVIVVKLLGLMLMLVGMSVLTLRLLSRLHIGRIRELAIAVRKMLCRRVIARFNRSATKRVRVLVILLLGVEMRLRCRVGVSACKVAGRVIVNTRPGIQEVVVGYKAITVSHPAIVCVDLADLVASSMVVLLSTRPAVTVTPLSHLYGLALLDGCRLIQTHNEKQGFT